ncbi:hypothetical protein SDC9_106944 [bioreactor metagenome]|uniref:Uncharacterized protein n=1 Tax=bioreactor metagenome TaxID=1076179 RepID=A0A645B3W1_9ZZZZ
MAEGGGVKVEGDAHGVGLLLVPQAQKRGQKAENSVGIKPVPGAEGADAVVSAVQNTVAVDGHELHKGASALLNFMYGTSLYC